MTGEVIQLRDKMQERGKTPLAQLEQLPETIVDDRLYAAIRGTKGYLVLQFAAGLTAEDVPFERPEAAFYAGTDAMADYYVETGGVIQEGLAAEFKRFTLPPRDPNQPAHLYNRKLQAVYEVKKSGSLPLKGWRNVVSEESNIILHFQDGAIHMISRNEARQRLRQAMPNGTRQKLEI